MGKPGRKFFLLSALFAGAFVAAPARAVELPVYVKEVACAAAVPDARDMCWENELVDKTLIREFMASGGRSAKSYVFDFCIDSVNDAAITPHPGYGQIWICLIKQRFYRQLARIGPGDLKRDCNSDPCDRGELFQELQFRRGAGVLGAAGDIMFDSCLAEAKASHRGFFELNICILHAQDAQSRASVSKR